MAAGLTLNGIPACFPAIHAAHDVGSARDAMLASEACCQLAAPTKVTDECHCACRVDLAEPHGQLAQGDVHGACDVALHPLPVLPHINDLHVCSGGHARV